MYEPGPPPETLSTGMTEKILSLLDSLQAKSPWFCYVHLFDLHPLREGRQPLKIDQFKSEQFGKSTYAKTVSSIDFWLMNIAKKIDYNNTVLVLTSDHGERIPFDEKISFQFEP
jgi:membrane-anchored protein YejM (alkaline phosphatase superfamily)